LQRSLWGAKTTGLAEVPSHRVLTVRYHNLLADPAAEVERLTEFLDLQVRLAQRERAVELVRPVRLA